MTKQIEEFLTVLAALSEKTGVSIQSSHMTYPIMVDYNGTNVGQLEQEWVEGNRASYVFTPKFKEVRRYFKLSSQETSD